MTDYYGPWNPPAPTQIPELRLRTLDYLSSPDLAERFTLDAGTVNATLVPLSSPHPRHVRPDLLSGHEKDRLSRARLYTVAPHVVDVARRLAARGVPSPMDITQAPSPYGFMVLGAPLGYGRFNPEAETLLLPPGSGFDPTLSLHAPIAAVSWGPWHPHPPGLEDHPDACWMFYSADGPRLLPNPDPAPGVWITFYISSRQRWSALPPDQTVALFEGRTLTAADMDRAEQAQTHTLDWHEEAIIRHGSTLGPLDTRPTTTDPGAWTALVYVLWQLMGRAGRRMTEAEEIPRPRGGRRRDERSGVHPCPVRVIRLNQTRTRSYTPTDSTAPPAARDWTCQWVVDPYYRDTCLNPRKHRDGECTHEEMIVEGHVKGPPDKPLRVSSTVRVLD